MGRLLVLLLGLSFSPLLSAEGLDLTIPSSPAEMKKLMGDDGPCKGCGVVTNVRQQAPAAVQDSPEDPTYKISFAEATRSGPGANVDVTGFRVNKAEESSDGGAWLITVRYDDGSYAAVESETQPSFQKGDRVQMVSGKLVPR